MELDKRQTKRMIAVMPEEEPVIVRTESKEYAAKLVNLAGGGVLISILECNLREEIGSHSTLQFTTAGRTFEVRGQLLRVVGWYAAFMFVELTKEQSEEIKAKLDRMEVLTEDLCPTLT